MKLEGIRWGLDEEYIESSLTMAAMDFQARTVSAIFLLEPPVPAGGHEYRKREKRRLARKGKVL